MQNQASPCAGSDITEKTALRGYEELNGSKETGINFVKKKIEFRQLRSSRVVFRRVKLC